MRGKRDLFVLQDCGHRVSAGKPWPLSRREFASPNEPPLDLPTSYGRRAQTSSRVVRAFPMYQPEHTVLRSEELARRIAERERTAGQLSSRCSRDPLSRLEKSRRERAIKACLRVYPKPRRLAIKSCHNNDELPGSMYCACARAGLRTTNAMSSMHWRWLKRTCPFTSAAPPE
jgi:hypothetical protein